MARRQKKDKRTKATRSGASSRATSHKDHSQGPNRRSRRGNGEGGVAHNLELATVTISVHPDGFAFGESEERDGAIFIPRGRLAGAMDGDEVVVSYVWGHRGPEGTVRSVVKRGRTRATGTLYKVGRHYRLKPDDPRILGEAEVVDGGTDAALEQLVLGTIVDYPDAWNDGFSVRLDAVLGEPESLVAEESKILIEHGIDPIMPPAVIEEAARLPERVLAGDRENRADLRELPFMTIDPPDARDFDDAVCVEVLGRSRQRARMRLHVAVADVSHYVRPGTKVDTEAVRRCFSSYLPDRAIPMLPESLSSGICSLVPRKDRCAMVVTMEIDAQGKVSDAQVRAAVIHSQRRLTYDQAALVMRGTSRLPDEIQERIHDLRTVADRLRTVRLGRGAVELNMPETRVQLADDDPSQIKGIVRSRSDEWKAKAYNLIEELMLAANETVGRIAVKHRLPVVFRVHDRPAAERLDKFAASASALGAAVDPEALVAPKAMQRFLQRHRSHERSGSFDMLLLRAMSQAEYDTENIGHFALASSAYVHFTSPIRRYADLISHRVLKAYLAQHGEPCGPKPTPPMPRLRTSAAQATRCCERERASTQAERDTKALFAAVYMRAFIGDEFDGTIVGMAESGLFVALDDPAVDGMIRKNELEREMHERYELEPSGVRMLGAKSTRTFTLGDRVRVQVLGADVARRRVELGLVSSGADS